MRLAHVSDLHLLDLEGVSWKRFLNRRVFGGANLLFRRAREYRPEVVEVMVDDLLKEEVDHVAVSGDLTNLALEGEFDRVFHLFKLLGGRDKVSVVPGNHDYYTFAAAESRKFEKYFYPFFDVGFSDLDVDIYPYQKRVGDLLIVGVNSATRTLPPMSYGTVGDRQLNLLDKVLGSAQARSCFTCLLMHHALHRRDRLTETMSGLLNRDRVLDLVDKHRVDLVLYGHDHRGRVWKREQQGHTTYLVCCGSSSRVVPDPARVARYRIIHIEEGRIRRIDTKVYDPIARRFMLE